MIDGRSASDGRGEASGGITWNSSPPVGPKGNPSPHFNRAESPSARAYCYHPCQSRLRAMLCIEATLCGDARLFLDVGVQVEVFEEAEAAEELQRKRAAEKQLQAKSPAKRARV